MMTECQESGLFQWSEVEQLFHITNNTDYDETRRQALLDQINRLAENHGREYVVKRIALAF
ncbi:MAG: hypothetical protein KKB70_01545 [Proteobacteria bacterium]|nr:hypothetical protein [Pseudomonadota bacterium]